MKAHRTDWFSLTFALIFLGIAAWWLVAHFVDLVVPEAGWVLAGALILFGALGLVGALRSGRSATAAPATPDEPAGLDDLTRFDDPVRFDGPAAHDDPTADIDSAGGGSGLRRPDQDDIRRRLGDPLD